MKATTYRKEVENIFMCIRGDRIFTPLAAALNYLAAAKQTLKAAKARKLKRAVKDIKRDIKVTKRIIAELRLTSDVRAAEAKILRRIKE